MMNKNFASNSVALNSAKDVQDIVKILTTHLNVSYFSYSKNYQDKSRIYLSTNEQWAQDYLTQPELFEIGAYNKHPNYIEGSYEICSFSVLPQLKEIMANQYGVVGEGIAIFNKQATFCEIFVFAIDDLPNHILPFYLNNLDLFHRFACYFKEQSIAIRKEAENFDRKFLQCRELAFAPSLVHYQQKSEELKAALQVKKYFLNEEVALSAKELDCAILLLQGKTSKEIAKLLGNSPRTIEVHLNNMKLKLGCCNKSELMSKLFKLNLHQYRGTR